MMVSALLPPACRAVGSGGSVPYLVDGHRGGRERRRSTMVVRFVALSAVATALVIGGTDGAVATTLQEAITIAVSSHPTVQKAKARKRATDQEVNEARADYFPTVDATGDVGYEYTDNYFTRNRGSGQGDTEEKLRNVIGGEIRQNLFQGFGTINRTRGAKERVSSAGHDLMDAEEAIGLRAAVAYLDVLRARHVVNLAQENVASHVQVRDDIKFKAQKGRSDSGDLNQAESRLALARTRLTQARGQLRDAETGYLEVVGQAPGTLEIPRPPYQAIPANIDLAVAAAEDTNPALLAALDDVKAREFEARAKREPYYPKFDISLRGHRGHDVNGVEGDDNALQALLVMDFNLYRGGGDQARYRRAIEQMSEARQREAEIRRLVQQQMRVEYTGLLTARENLPISESRAQAAAQVASAYIQQFELGRRSLLDVLDVVGELFQANVGVVNTDTEMMRASYRVLATAGTLLSTLDVTTDTAAAWSGQPASRRQRASRPLPSMKR
jgi:adhesin transport system outer membrane protein